MEVLATITKLFFLYWYGVRTCLISNKLSVSSVEKSIVAETLTVSLGTHSNTIAGALILSFLYS